MLIHQELEAESKVVLAFALGFSKVAVGFFGLLVSFVQNWPQLHGHD